MSCADVQTIQAGNGSKTQFSFDFPYIFKSEIQVSFWNATTKEWDVIAQGDATYPWQVTDANPTIVEFTSTAPPAPAVPVDPNETSVDNVRIRRVTNIDDIRALFNPGSAIRSDDLNKNFEQLRYAIQESNCQGVTDDVYQYLLDNYWDRFDNTIYSADAWRSDDATIATTAALDQRFQDEVTDTLTKAELAANANVMPDNDVAVPTTGALNDYINEVITNDIGTDGTGITITDDGDGTITLGLGSSSIDFDRIKDSDIITVAEQNSGSPAPADSNIFTASAAARRFDTIIQTSTPSGSDWEVGKTWLQNDNDKTLYMWNGSSWLPVVSGGTFTELSKVIYVDSINGDDTLNGHRISNPKKTIKAAIDDINADPSGDGSVVIVAPGIYGETFPIDIEKNDISVVGTSLRNCIIHPAIPTGDQAGYDVNTPEPNELETMFRVNSGSYFYGLTLTGMKASGARGGNALDTDPTYGLPTNQGWNFAFFPNAAIRKSPYIQNCTNFSDSKINNVVFTPHTPGEGSAGDLTSAPTGGGILVDGSAVNSSSPLRSMVCDSYTHTALDGPGIFITNNGYAQCTSSYAFFNHFHIKCLNGGQANLAASTTDFGRYGLIASGRSTSSIFTATTTALANDNAITFTIDAPVAQAGWHGSATRPQSNMLVDIGGNTYPILSSVPNGAGWDVTISRPNPAKRDENLGLDGSVANGSSATFYLRSMIASSGHTMEYVGSGTNYTALPENGGVPIEVNQVVELNNGKIWTAITDHNGKFKVGDFFTVDQQSGFVSVPVGSISFPTLTEDLNINGHNIVDNLGSVNINDQLDMNSHKIVNVTNLEVASGTAAAPSVSVGSTDNGLYSPGSDQVAISTNGTGRLFVGSDGKIGIGNTVASSMVGNGITIGTGVSGQASVCTVYSNSDTYGALYFADATSGAGRYAGGVEYVHSSDALGFYTNSGERLRITSDGKLGLGTSSPTELFHLEQAGSSDVRLRLRAFASGGSGAGRSSYIGFDGDSTNASNNYTYISDGTNKRLVVTNGGNVGIGTTSPSAKLEIGGIASSGSLEEAFTIDRSDGTQLFSVGYNSSSNVVSLSSNNKHLVFANGTSSAETARIDSSGRLLVGTSSTVNGSVLGSAETRTGQFYTNTDSGNQGVGIYNVSATPFSARLELGTAKTSYAALSTDNYLGLLSFVGSDGSKFVSGAMIAAQVDGACSNDDIPTRLVFSTTADGSASPTERMRIDSSGRLGLGTSSPDYLLTVGSSSGATSTPTAIKLDSTYSTSPASRDKLKFYLYKGATEAYGLTVADGSDLQYWAGSNSTGVHRWFTSGTERFRIDSSGRLLVGTSSTTNTNLRAIFQGTPASSTGTGYLYLSMGRSNPTSGQELGALAFSDNGHVSSASIIGVHDGGTWTSGSSQPTRLVFSTTADGSASPTERLRIDSSGRVGIGSTSPAGLLDVAGGNIHLTEDTNVLWQNAARNTNRGALQFDSSGNFRVRYGSGLTEGCRLDSSGRLLVGTSSARSNFFNSSATPSTLQVEATSSTSGFGFISTVYNSNDANATSIIIGKTRGTAIGGNTVVNSGDNIGSLSFQASDGTELVPAATISAAVDGTPGANDMPGRLVFSTTADGASSPTERMRISNSGVHHMFGATGVCYARSATGAGTAERFFIGYHSATGVTTGGTISFNVYTNGDVTNTNNSYGGLSDIKLKENIVDASSQWDDLKDLRVVNYNFKEGQTHTQIGLIAQEVELVSPGLVSESPDRDEDGNDLGTVTKSVNYSVLYMKAVKALQEAMERIEVLEAKVNALEGN